MCTPAEIKRNDNNGTPASLHSTRGASSLVRGPSDLQEHLQRLPLRLARMRWGHRSFS
jgi:hypothetical protein